MKLNSALSSLLGLIAGLVLFAWGCVAKLSGTMTSLVFVTACIFWLGCLWQSLHRWRERGASGREGTVAILMACLAAVFVLGCLFYVGWVHAPK